MKNFAPLGIMLVMALSLSTFSCKKSSSNKNSSRATGWKINAKEGGFQYNTEFKEQETAPGLVFIEGGTFTMGKVQDDVMHDWNNSPNQQHVQSFYMDETEVTNLMYLEYLDWLKRTYPNQEHAQVSHETIYRSLFIQARGVLKKELLQYLRSQRTIRRSGHSSLKKNGLGQIANMASIHAHICTPNKSVYCITKFDLRGLTQAISAEGEGKIRSFSLSTAYVKTPLVLNQIADQARARNVTAKQVVEDIMLGKSRIKDMMTPTEVANLLMFGFSHHGRFLIGSDMLFDGGVVLTYK